MAIEEGKPAPAFTLTDASGRKVSLKDFQGKDVIVYFYPKDDTPGCTKQACGFRNEFPRIETANATVVGLSPDQPKALAKWKAKERLPYTLVSDPDHAVAEAYGAWGEKTSFGITRTGILRGHAIISADGEIEDLQLKISPDESVERAVKFLDGA